MSCDCNVTSTAGQAEGRGARGNGRGTGLLLQTHPQHGSSCSAAQHPEDHAGQWEGGGGRREEGARERRSSEIKLVERKGERFLNSTGKKMVKVLQLSLHFGVIFMFKFRVVLSVSFLIIA